jgi:hypothetical protein
MGTFGDNANDDDDEPVFERRAVEKPGKLNKLQYLIDKAEAIKKAPRPPAEQETKVDKKVPVPVINYDEESVEEEEQVRVASIRDDFSQDIEIELPPPQDSQEMLSKGALRKDREEQAPRVQKGTFVDIEKFAINAVKSIILVPGKELLNIAQGNPRYSLFSQDAEQA